MSAPQIRCQLKALEKQGEDYIWRTAKAAGEEIDRLNVLVKTLESALGSAENLCDSINEFGACPDAEIFEAADTKVRAALALIREHSK